ncbi:MAG: ABC transporter ATP-binding protein [Flavobacteriales bacterium]|nr:ABC transporter ATP-binding protein [Flavobacteriales bacterium]
MAEPRIEFHDVGKSFGRLWALRQVNCSFMPGEVVMLIGPNASGKTTLIKCLLGLVHPTEGSIHMSGMAIGRDPSYRTAIGYMPQISQFPATLTIAQLLDMMADVRGLAPGEPDDGLVETLGLSPQMDKRLATLSGGTKQKVSAVLALRTRPQVLVMDEPTAGLDPVSASLVLEQAVALRNAGGTVLITSHLMEEVEAMADRVAYLEEGRLRFLLPVQEILARTDAKRLSQALPRLLEDRQLHVPAT